MASSSSARACPTCTFLNEDTQSAVCELCYSVLPSLTGQQATNSCTSGRVTAALSGSKGKSAVVECGWPKDDGTLCTYRGRLDNVNVHRASVTYHSQKRLRDSNQQGNTIASMFKRKAADAAAVSAESTPASEVNEPAQNKVSSSSFSALAAAVNSVTNAVSRLSTRSARVTPEIIADVVIARLEAREKEREETVAQRARAERQTAVHNQLLQFSEASQFSAVGFLFESSTKRLFCANCIKFRHKIHGSMLFLANARYGYVSFDMPSDESKRNLRLKKVSSVAVGVGRTYTQCALHLSTLPS